jgi:hypothetical protein
MDIVVEVQPDFDGSDVQPPVCTCRPEYVIRKDGERQDRHRIDPFCPCHGRHYRREIASAFCRAFNRRRFFSNFIVHLGPKEDPSLTSWAKRYVRQLIKEHFDKNAIIKCVFHPKDGDHHLQFGVGSDVGHVTLAALMNAKSPRGRKPRLDLYSAWVDGYRKDEVWNWCAYVLRIDEGWREDEEIMGRQRRSWRSRAEKGERIKPPTFTGRDQWYGADDVIVDDHDDVAVDRNKHVAIKKEEACSWLLWCFVPALRWMARQYLCRMLTPNSSSRRRISPFVRGIQLQDGYAGQDLGRRFTVTHLARPPPSARSPPTDVSSPTFRGHDVLDFLGARGVVCLDLGSSRQ